jgi:hypothetical protein
MRQRALAVPGVDAASLTVGVPFEGQYALRLRVPGQDSIPGMARGHAPFLYAVTPDFFKTLGTRLLSGRIFTDADGAGPAVGVVSAQMARQIWPAQSPIGQCIVIELRGVPPTCIHIIGVVEDARREALLESAEFPQYYVPLDQAPRPMTELSLLVRTSNPDHVMATLPRVLQSVRADMPFVHVRPLENAVAQELRPWRLGASVFALFGLLALVVAAVGTYSVMQFSVSQRIHEMGVRIALGAQRAQLLYMVAGQSFRMAAWAASTGIVLVLGSGNAIETMLFETSPRDPLVIATAVLVVLVVSIAATLPPAWRATRADPLTALKAE